MKEHIVKKIGTFLLDIVAPPDPTVRRIESMSVKEFMETAARDTTSDNISPYALFSYKDPLVKTAVLEVKSYGNKKLALLLGTALYIHLCEKHTRPAIIIPIPITRKSLRVRGWNQCELVCTGLKKVDAEKRFEVRTDILYKIRETADQVGKGRQERFENLQNCFEVAESEKVRGKNVIIFDDILTTGATLGEAARAIESAGSKHITCIALAH